MTQGAPASQSAIAKERRRISRQSAVSLGSLLTLGGHCNKLFDLEGELSKV
jgi:hypothetical protein